MKALGRPLTHTHCTLAPVTGDTAVAEDRHGDPRPKDHALPRDESTSVSLVAADESCTAGTHSGLVTFGCKMKLV
jgi:hypothetical protein